MIEVDREAIGGIIGRVAEREGLELVHWELAGPAGSFALRIFIDKPAGVSHSDCEVVSHQVSTLLDVEDLIPNRYTLEVSSPGLERGLYKRGDYQRFAGSRLKLRTVEPIDGQRNFRGRLIGIDDQNIRFDADGRGQIEIPYEKILKANIEYEF